MMTNGLSLDDPAYFARLDEIESQHWWSVSLRRLTDAWLDRALRGRFGLTLLDIGCGTGSTASRLRDRSEIARVIGIDPSPEAISRASNKGFDGLFLGSAEALPIDDASVDLVVSFDVLQHLPPRCDRLACSEIARVLRPGGLVVIRSNGRGGWTGLGDHSPYSLDELTALIAGSGLEIVKATYANCFGSLVQELRGWVRTGDRRGGHPSGGGLRIAMPGAWINRLMGLVAGLEAIAAGKGGLRLPFGHSTMILARKISPIAG